MAEQNAVQARQAGIAARDQIDAMQRTSASVKICRTIAAMPLYQNSQVILLYRAVRAEVDLSTLALQAVQDLRDFANGGGGVMLITHDVELALRVADRIAVFQDGTVVEETSVAAFASPEGLRHPFTRALWRALPEHGFAAPVEEGVHA